MANPEDRHLEERHPRAFLSRSQSIERQNGKRSRTDGDMNIAVLGHSGVGKSAIIVRYITKRFIGDYSHHESICTYNAVFDGKPVRMSIMDTSGTNADDSTSENGSRKERMSWADSFLVVFSMTDRASFDRLHVFIDHISSLKTTSSGRRSPMVLLANKSDLAHRRVVSDAEARHLAAQFRCPYIEASASDSHAGVASAFTVLFYETRAFMKKEKIRRLAYRGTLSRISQLRETLRSLTESRERTYTF